MNKNKKNVPNIRFPGFTEPWEQRKLGDVAEFGKGNGYSKGDLIEFGTPIILYGRLYTKYETSISDVDTFVEAKDGSVYSKGGEVIIPASGETAEDIARATTVYKSGILLGGDLNVVMPNEDINSAFLAISISNGNSQRELAKKAQGKSVVHIHNEEIRNLIVPFPTKVEQNKIAEYFSSLDHLITLQQRKLDHLKEQKKGLLQKMFPKKGEKVPEIRFPGFTDDWEMRKLGEITQIKTGSSDLQDAVEDGKYPFFVRSENIEHSNRYIFEGEAILIPGEGRLGEIYHYINGKFDYHQRVYKISNFADSNTNGKYILYFMEKNFKQHALKFTVKATVDSLRLPMLTEFNILLPSLSEQEKISVFFTSFDNLITLHQRKLDHLKEQKKGLLQQMFV